MRVQYLGDGGVNNTYRSAITFTFEVRMKGQMGITVPCRIARSEMNLTLEIRSLPQQSHYPRTFGALKQYATNA